VPVRFELIHAQDFSMRPIPRSSGGRGAARWPLALVIFLRRLRRRAAARQAAARETRSSQAKAAQTFPADRPETERAAGKIAPCMAAGSARRHG
jgi:hypothetical protein